MSASRATEDVEIHHVDEREATDLFDAICRHELGMTGVEFLERWDAGQYRGVDVDEVDGLGEVVASISLIR